MLAARRVIAGSDDDPIRTPLLVPSFSSKSDTDWDVKGQIRLMAEHIATPILMSAYDIHYGLVAVPEFPSVLFLDSGGYEAHRDVLAAESRGDTSMLVRQPWNPDLHREALRGIRCPSPVVAVTYDHPNLRVGVAQQIEAAHSFSTGSMRKELLLKPEADQEPLPVATIADLATSLAGFDVIGVTDKELGRTMIDRLIAVARLRRALSGAGLDTPIHIFGSLDPITTPLYFLAGADVFDGLAWLRYAMNDRGTFYLQNYGVLECGLTASKESVQAMTWQRNYVFLMGLEGRMRSFLKSRDFAILGANAALFKEASGIVEEEVDG